MKRIIVVLGIAFLATNSLFAQKLKMKNEVDSVSYSLGVNIGKNIKKSGVENLNYELVAKALEAAIKGEKQILDDETMGKSLETFFKKIQQQKMDKNKLAGEDFLKKNKERKEVTTTTSGLQYEVITMGTGVKPNDTDMVQVHYHGTLIDGKVFDSSIDRGKPVSFPVNGVIPGWTEALKLMPVGSKWKLYIPASLGYGEQGAGGVIEGNTVLIFEVQLLEIQKAGVQLNEEVEGN
jgi:FKBP-type peptidyl-prolyl cis-trans isomerase FklB